MQADSLASEPQGSPRILELVNTGVGSLLPAEGNGSPLQHSGLENPRDGGAWWAAVYGVAESRTRLKRLSRSSSSLFPPQGTFPTEESNWGLLHCRWILYQLSYQGSRHELQVRTHKMYIINNTNMVKNDMPTLLKT